MKYKISITDIVLFAYRSKASKDGVARAVVDFARLIFESHDATY